MQPVMVVYIATVHTHSHDPQPELHTYIKFEPDHMAEHDNDIVCKLAKVGTRR